MLGCLHGARHELSPAQQKRLLRAAAFGKVYVPKGVDRDLLAATCSVLRVLNQLRSDRVGMPLTWGQLEHLGMPTAVLRLLARHEHDPLAWRLAGFLRLRGVQAAVVHHWCCLLLGTHAH